MCNCMDLKTSRKLLFHTILKPFPLIKHVNIFKDWECMLEEETYYQKVYGQYKDKDEMSEEIDSECMTDEEDSECLVLKKEDPH